MHETCAALLRCLIRCLVWTGLAYASLVGVDPLYGVFTVSRKIYRWRLGCILLRTSCGQVIFPPIVYSIFGQSKQGAVGPMSIPCLIIAAVVDSRVEEGGGMEDRVQLTMALTMAIGVVRPNAPPRRLEIQVGSKRPEANLRGCGSAGVFPCRAVPARWLHRLHLEQCSHGIHPRLGTDGLREYGAQAARCLD